MIIQYNCIYYVIYIHTAQLYILTHHTLHVYVCNACRRDLFTKFLNLLFDTYCNLRVLLRVFVYAHLVILCNQNMSKQAL